MLIKTCKTKLTRNYRITLACLLAVMLACVCTSLPALTADKYLPYFITSNSAIHNSNTNQTEFIGNSIITQGSTKIVGDRAIIYQKPGSNTISKLVVIGKPAVYSTMPDNKKQRLYARALTIDYFPKTRDALLIGNAVVTEGKDSLSGDRIWYDTVNRKVISRSPGKRSTLTISPQSKKE